jgi:hypothetical protein
LQKVRTLLVASYSAVIFLWVNVVGEFQRQDHEDGEIFGTVKRCLELAKTFKPTTERPNSIIVVCGSAFIMSEARRAFGLVEPIDSIPMSSSKQNSVNN